MELSFWLRCFSPTRLWRDTQNPWWMGKILHCMRYVVAPNQSIPIVTLKIMTVNACVNFLNISSHLMETFMLLFYLCVFAIINKVVKRILIFSVLCTCQNSFSQKYKSSSHFTWGSSWHMIFPIHQGFWVSCHSLVGEKHLSQKLNSTTYKHKSIFAQF